MAEIHRYHSYVIVQAFRKVGLSIALDGPEDDKLRIKDVPELKSVIRHVRKRISNWAFLIVTMYPLKPLTL